MKKKHEKNYKCSGLYHLCLYLRKNNVRVDFLAKFSFDVIEIINIYWIVIVFKNHQVKINVVDIFYWMVIILDKRDFIQVNPPWIFNDTMNQWNN